jgi:hypothetical protein
MNEVSQTVLDEYEVVKRLPDGRLIGVHQFMFTWGFHIDINEYGYEDRYCFHDREKAINSMLKYDGVTEPTGWHRHPSSGRRRNLETGEEWIQY